MTALAIVAYILGALVLALWAVGVFIMTVIEQEEKCLRDCAERTDMYESEENERRES